MPLGHENPDAPWFGYAPAERPSEVKRIALEMVGNHDLPVVTDELWMDVIAEDIFDRRLPRAAHGKRAGALWPDDGEPRCRCFLCMKWRSDEHSTKIIDLSQIL